ncbi:MAG: TolB-like protein, partial [Rhodothermales bacterium]
PEDWVRTPQIIVTRAIAPKEGEIHPIDFAKIATLAGNITEWIDDTAAPGTMYAYECVVQGVARATNYGDSGPIPAVTPVRTSQIAPARVYAQRQQTLTLAIALRQPHRFDLVAHAPLETLRKQIGAIPWAMLVERESADALLGEHELEAGRETALAGKGMQHADVILETRSRLEGHIRLVKIWLRDVWSGGRRRIASTEASEEAASQVAAQAVDWLQRHYGGDDARQKVKLDDIVLAVLPLRALSPDAPGGALAELMVQPLAEAGGTLVERSAWQDVLAEQTRISGNLSQAVEASRLLGADALVTGTVAEREGRLDATVRVIDVASSSVIGMVAANAAPGEIDALAVDIVAALQHALTRIPAERAHPLARALEGSQWKGGGERSEAIANAKRRVLLEKTDWRPRQALAHLLREAGDFAEASAQFEIALTLADLPELRSELSSTYEDWSRLEEPLNALALIDKALANADELPMHLWEMRTALLHELGRGKEALHYLQGLLAEHTGEEAEELHLRVARSMHAIGNVAEAAKALAEGPATLSIVRQLRDWGAAEGAARTLLRLTPGSPFGNDFEWRRELAHLLDRPSMAAGHEILLTGVIQQAQANPWVGLKLTQQLTAIRELTAAERLAAGRYRRTLNHDADAMADFEAVRERGTSEQALFAIYELTMARRAAGLPVTALVDAGIANSAPGKMAEDLRQRLELLRDYPQVRLRNKKVPSDRGKDRLIASPGGRISLRSEGGRLWGIMDAKAPPLWEIGGLQDLKKFSDYSSLLETIIVLRQSTQTLLVITRPDGGLIEAINASTGDLRWRHIAWSKISYPFFWQGEIIFRSQIGGLFAMSTNGEILRRQAVSIEKKVSLAWGGGTYSKTAVKASSNPCHLDRVYCKDSYDDGYRIADFSALPARIVRRPQLAVPDDADLTALAAKIDNEGLDYSARKRAFHELAKLGGQAALPILAKQLTGKFKHDAIALYADLGSRDDLKPLLDAPYPYDSWYMAVAKVAGPQDAARILAPYREHSGLAVSVALAQLGIRSEDLRTAQEQESDKSLRPYAAAALFQE